MFSGVAICVPSGCYDMYVDLGMKKSKVGVWNSVIIVTGHASNHLGGAPEALILVGSCVLAEKRCPWPSNGIGSRVKPGMTAWRLVNLTP